MDDPTSWFGGRFFRGGRPPHRPGHPGAPGAPPEPPGVPPVPPVPPWPFGFNPWQAMIRRRMRARRGDVRAAILALLAEQPRNGYQIMQELEQRSRGAWRPSPGAVYPALQQLEDEGLIRVDTTGGGRVFHLTDMGREASDARDDEPPPWEAPADAGEGRHELMAAVRQLMVAAGQVGQTGTPAQIAAARKAVDEARRALYRALAEDDAGADDGDDDDDE